MDRSIQIDPPKSSNGTNGSLGDGDCVDYRIQFYKFNVRFFLARRHQKKFQLVFSNVVVPSRCFSGCERRRSCCWKCSSSVFLVVCVKEKNKNRNNASVFLCCRVWPRTISTTGSRFQKEEEKREEEKKTAPAAGRRNKTHART